MQSVHPHEYVSGARPVLGIRGGEEDVGNKPRGLCFRNPSWDLAPSEGWMLRPPLGGFRGSIGSPGWVWASHQLWWTAVGSCKQESVESGGECVQCASASLGPCISLGTSLIWLLHRPTGSEALSPPGGQDGHCPTADRRIWTCLGSSRTQN